MNTARRLGLLLLALLAASLQAQQPNVLFITIDDLRPTLGCYDDPIAITPEIDQLAADGVTFLNASCPSPVCGPSRSAMTTGLWPEETGIRSFENIRELVPDAILLPQHFKENGYRTAAVGKWHDHRSVGDGTPKEEDPYSWTEPFDYGGANLGQGNLKDRNGRNWPLAASAKDEPDRKFTDAIRADLGLAHISNLAANYRDNGQPFFLGVGFARPHLPFFAPQKYWDLYERSDFTPLEPQSREENHVSWTYDNVHELENYYILNSDADGFGVPFAWDGPNNPYTLSLANQQELLHGYYACTSFVDVQVGRLLDALEAEGIADNTIVVVLGDHGFHLGDHLKWGKHTPMEESVRSPLIIKAPGISVAGLRTESPVTFLDLYPTLCELAGLPIPEQPIPPALQAEQGGATHLPLRGLDITSILSDPDADDLRFGALSIYRKGPHGYSYRTRTHRYIEWVQDDGEIKNRALFDIVNDPNSTRNIAEDPGNELLLYRLAVKLRQESESPGAMALRNSQPIPLEQTIYDADYDSDGHSNGYEVDVLDTDPFNPPSASETSFQQWMSQHGLSGDNLLEDPDADGSPNLLEYLFDRNPMEADVLPQTVTLNASQQLGISLQTEREAMPSDTQIALQGSDELGANENWIAVAYDYERQANPSGGWTHRWVQRTPLDSGGKRFLRLTVSIP